MTDVHVLDEAEHVAGASEVLGERHDAVVVGTALHDGIHLHAEACRCSCVDPVEHLLHGEVDVVQRPERRVVDRVQTDGHAVEPRAG